MIEQTEKLVNSFEKYISVLSKVADKHLVENISEKFGERLVLSPRGLTEKDGGNPGGLIDFSLSVASASKSISSVIGDTKSLVKVSLLHELGRIGDLENDLYVPQDSDWHREKLGQNYKYNENCPKMSISHRTLWLLNNCGAILNREEYLAILTSQGLHLNENQFYGQEANRNPIIIGLQAARGVALQAHN